MDLEWVTRSTSLLFQPKDISTDGLSGRSPNRLVYILLLGREQRLRPGCVAEAQEAKPAAAIPALSAGWR